MPVGLLWQVMGLHLHAMSSQWLTRLVRWWCLLSLPVDDPLDTFKKDAIRMFGMERVCIFPQRAGLALMEPSREMKAPLEEPVFWASFVPWLRFADCFAACV